MAAPPPDRVDDGWTPVYASGRRAGLTGCAAGLVLAGLAALAAAPAGGADRPGLPAPGPWSCPASHPIKGYVSAESGRRVYFVPSHPFYDEASPERCYASEDEARHDGSRPAGAPAPAPGGLAHFKGRSPT